MCIVSVTLYASARMNHCGDLDRRCEAESDLTFTDLMESRLEIMNIARWRSHRCSKGDD
jgi:hypothetical protein